MTGLRAWFAAAALLLAAGCAGGVASDAPTFAKETTRLDVPDATTLLAATEVRIAPLDRIRVSFLGVADLSGEYQVDSVGEVRLPLVGVVEAKGYTPNDFAEALETRYNDRYLKDAEVSVLIVSTTGDQLTVEGTIRKPGLVPVRGRMTLLQAIAISGGLDEGANARKVLIFRQVNGERRVAAFDLVAIRRGKMEDPQVFGNDLIVVDGSSTSRGYRELLRSLPLLGLFAAVG